MSDAAYKYMSAPYALRTLRELELKITPPNQFNDPLEFSPRVICSSPKREAKRLLKQKAEIKEMYEEEKRLGTFKGNFHQYREKIRKHRTSLISGVATRIHETNAYLQHHNLDVISTAVGVLSLSRRADSILMWGHYGDNHRGLVIGFDTAWETFRAGRGLGAVQYSRERLTWDISWKGGSVALKDYVERMIRHKNHEWAYEEELRQVFQLAGLRQRRLDNGSTGYFLPIPPSIVRCVILGLRCPEDVENQVCDILGEKPFSHIGSPKRAHLHETNFAIEFS